MSNIAIMVGLIGLGCVLVVGVLLLLLTFWGAEHE